MALAEPSQRPGEHSMTLLTISDGISSPRDSTPAGDGNHFGENFRSEVRGDACASRNATRLFCAPLSAGVEEQPDVRCGCIADYAVLRKNIFKNVEHSPHKVNDCEIPGNFFREKS